MEQLLTPEQVADYLQVTKRAVYEWLRTGRLKGLRAGRWWRVHPDDLQVFLEAGSGPSESSEQAIEEGESNNE